MNKTSHVMIGRLLCRRLREQYGIYLNEGAFLIGSVLPDLGVSFLLRPHFLKYHYCTVLRRIDGILSYDKQASAFFGRGYSVELGIICHYYADFFCFPHSSAYPKDVFSHVKYEKELGRFLRSCGAYIMDDDDVDISIRDVTTEEIFTRFSKLHEGYARRAPSFENDITQCLKACTELLVLLTGSTLAEQPIAGELLYPV